MPQVSRDMLVGEFSSDDSLGENLQHMKRRKRKGSQVPAKSRSDERRTGLVSFSAGGVVELTGSVGVTHAAMTKAERKERPGMIP